jgi:hypothetical protein
VVKTIEAVFDGKAFLPEESPALEPNTRVRIIIEAVLPATAKATSFLHTARSLNLEGPPDWAVNLDTYLYSAESHQDG